MRNIQNKNDAECLHCKRRFLPAREADIICPTCNGNVMRWRQENNRWLKEQRLHSRIALVLWAAVMVLILWIILR
jgi:Zn finger protein HypA/HybF involved in hydrogenase expression